MSFDLIVASNRIWAPVINHLWQATLFSGFAYVAARAMRRGSARSRYLVWIAASVKFVLPSAAIVFLFGVVSVPLRLSLPPVTRISPAYKSISPVVYPFGSDVADVAKPVAAGAFAHEQPDPPGSSSILPSILSVLTIVWLIGIVITLVRWRLGRRSLLKSLRSSEFVIGGREWRILREVRTDMKIWRQVRLIVSPQISEPAVWGSFKPVVVLPQGIGDLLVDEEIHAVMMHEMAHVLRWDNLISDLQMVLCCVFWFHPLVWFIDRRLLEERELACDEMVLNYGGRSTSYANTLMKIYRFCLGSEVRGLSAVASSNIAKRLELILESTARSRITKMQRLIVVIVMLTCVVFILAAGMLGGSNGLGRSISSFRDISTFPSEGAANLQTEIPSVSSIGSSVVPQKPASIGQPVDAVIHASRTSQQPESVRSPQEKSPEVRRSEPPPVVAESADVAISRMKPMSSSHYADFSRFAGRYVVDPSRMENFVFDVSTDGNELWLKPSYTSKIELIQRSGTEFVDTAGKIHLTFNTDARGNVFSFTLEGWHDTLTVQKIVLPSPSLTGTTVFHIPGSAGAKIVAIAGSFNGWNQSQFLFARIDDEWVCRINLPPGRYLYKFVIDGNWIVDPGNDVTEGDGRGNLNSVLTVE
jgi:beta-lactamase regulating signal transducer with metallopeptidase domain